MYMVVLPRTFVAPETRSQTTGGLPQHIAPQNQRHGHICSRDICEHRDFSYAACAWITLCSPTSRVRGNLCAHVASRDRISVCVHVVLNALLFDYRLYFIFVKAILGGDRALEWMSNTIKDFPFFVSVVPLYVRCDCG